MSGTLLRTVATGAASVTAVAGVAVFWLAVQLPELTTGDVAGSIALGPTITGMTVLAVTGTLVVRIRPSARIGWLLVTAGTTGVLAPLTLALAALAQEHHHATAPLLGWVTNWSWIPGQLLALLLILHFPDGRLPGPRWRAMRWTVVAWGALTISVAAVYPGELGASVLAPQTNPLGIEALDRVLDPLLSGLFTVLPALVLAGALAPVSRWRRAAPEERRQLRAVALALLVLGVAAPLALASGAGVVLEGLAWLVLPVVIAYAVARHDLLELDIRRRFDRLRRVREEERSRLQRDLHDSLGPLLGSITMRVEAARNLVAADAATDRVDELLSAIGGDAETAVVEVRRFIDELAPSTLAETGLAGALHQLVQGYSSAGLRITLHVPRLPRLEPEAEVALYRVASEALRNVVRHSAAEHCEVALRVRGDDVELVVSDDGTGLRGQPAGVGRRAMADRIDALGGFFSLDEPDRGGVVVRARLRGALA